MGSDPPMKALVIGASGQVGGHLMNALQRQNIPCTATHHGHPTQGSIALDITNPSMVEQVIIAARPTHIFLPAAATNVDYCESQPDQTYLINVLGTQHVVKASNQAHAKLIYFSSDYIFDGKHGPYTEEDTPNPICKYGSQKVYAEHHITAFCNDYLILRTTIVYGWENQEKNFVIRLIKSLRANQKVRVPSDQIGTPTYASNLAEACLHLAQTVSTSEIFNLTGPSVVSRYEFAREAARVFDLPPDLIEPVQTKDLNQTASRPLNLGLIVKKASAALPFPLLGYQEGLREMKKIQIESAQ